MHTGKCSIDSNQEINSTNKKMNRANKSLDFGAKKTILEKRNDVAKSQGQISASNKTTILKKREPINHF